MRRARSLAAAAALLLAGACAAPDRDVPTRAVAPPPMAALPAMKTFPPSSPRPVRASNADVARDFLDLAFELESGRALDLFTRFEGPITLRLIGTPTPTIKRDLAQLLVRLRTEAGIRIQQTTSADAAITIEAVPRGAIRDALPQAACFVVPNVSSLAEYAKRSSAPQTRWSRLDRRTRVALFIPADASPQEARDCLHEELAQALGPLNDLYRLSDSVFNDDNVHSVLTPWDMLILRVWYDPGLRSGLTRPEVAARLPNILARVNPEGARIPPRGLPRTPRAWTDAMQTALGPGTNPRDRRASASTALRIAKAEGWTDHRLGFAHFANGRLLQPIAPDAAHAHFTQAYAIFANRPDTQLHRVHIAAQLAAHALSEGRAADAETMIAAHLPLAREGRNAALYASLLMLRAEAFELQGRSSEARAARLDSLAWARYGFGAETVLRARMRDLDTLRTRRNGL